MVVIMQYSSCYNASSNSMGTYSEMKVKCHHKIDSKLIIVKSDSNCGKKFYECPLRHVSEKIFRFCED